MICVFESSTFEVTPRGAPELRHGFLPVIEAGTVVYHSASHITQRATGNTAPQ